MSDSPEAHSLSDRAERQQTWIVKLCSPAGTFGGPYRTWAGEASDEEDARRMALRAVGADWTPWAVRGPFMLVDHSRGDPTDPSTDLENVNAAYVVERDEAERLRAENEKLRWALEEACSDAWTDGESAAQQYMRRAESRPESDEEVGSDGI